MKTELRTVGVSDIVEYPTTLGNRCLLLQELGFNAYWNTEEELLEVLSSSSKNDDMLKICLNYSPCQRFWEGFSQGLTPFAKNDPIRLAEYKGRYWASEGKHRVCLAKRAGVKNIEAVVYNLKHDTMTLLQPEGMPGQYSFSYSFSGSKAQGVIAFLQVHIPNGFEMKLDIIGLQGTWLGENSNTSGQFVEVVPGIKYKVSCRKHRKKIGWFKSQYETIVESEVMIDPKHPKTKVWLLQMPVADNSTSFHTVYRQGCWRKGHLLNLRNIWPCI